MNLRAIFPLIAVCSTFSACSKKTSEHTGRYLYNGRNTMMGEEFTQVEVYLNADKTASANIRVHGYLQGVGTSQIDTQIAARGRWKDKGKKAEATLDIEKWTDMGRSLTPMKPLILTFKRELELNVEAPKIQSKEGNKFLPLFDTMFGRWTQEPLP